MTWWLYPVYIVSLIIIVFLSLKLADYVDLLDKKTKISGAFIGGVLLAAVTSLPELFTAIASVTFVNNPSLVIGDILGSDIFDLIVLLLYTVFFFRTYRNSTQSKYNFIHLFALIVFYGLTAYAIFAPKEMQIMIGHVNLVSIVILAGYIALLIFQPKSENVEKEEANTKLSLKQIIVLFTVCSLLLIGASICIAILSDKMINEISWLNGTVGGAILLGVATSLPEVISTWSLFKKKNFDAAFSNMIGSCTFNFSILTIANLLSWRNATIGSETFIATERGIFWSSQSAKYLTIFGLAVIIITLLIMFIGNFTKLNKKKPKLSFAINLMLVSAATACYILSLVLK